MAMLALVSISIRNSRDMGLVDIFFARFVSSSRSAAVRTSAAHVSNSERAPLNKKVDPRVDRG